jgi:hypothetical protein
MPRVNVWIPDELYAAAKAMRLSWSQTIQEAIKTEIAKRAEGPPLPGPLSEQEARWQAAADLAGLSLSEWIRAACDVAATIHHDPKPYTGEGVITTEQAKAEAARILAERTPSPAFPEPPRPELPPAAKCSHRNRKSLGYVTVCADCGEKVA